MTKINFHKAFFVLKMWQTGNVGPHNIMKVEGQPEEGFLIYRDAETWLNDNIEKIDNGLWDKYLISMLYWK